MSETESKDLALAPNEYAFCMDSQSGSIRTFSGPFNHSLSKTDQLVRFNHTSKTFEIVGWGTAKMLKHVAPEGWYIALKNPTKDPAKAHPVDGNASVMPELDIGRKVIVHGPVSFSAWPGQMIRIIQGHHIRHNQYLVVRVYDEEIAAANWDKQLLKTRDGKRIEKPTDLRTGKLFVIRGDQVSFYMPTTGIEVVAFEFGERTSYVRDAVTLERLEYCLLIDQSGDKRYVQGPSVVFPEPTEEFFEKKDDDGNAVRKFRAYELNPNSGLYVKVIESYEEGGVNFSAGDELFITGKDTPIYFPRKEHSVIKYEDREIHYGIMIPEGEARYVANRVTGEISLVKGPQLFLPDPRTQIIVRRVLEENLCSLMYPGNIEALEYNAALLPKEKEEEFTKGGIRGVSVNSVLYAAAADSIVDSEPKPGSRRVKAQAVGKSAFGNELVRATNYQPPRTLTLNTKYDGAVTIDVWEGYAVMLTSRGESGSRRIIVGPRTAMLEYHEAPHVLTLSTKVPKSTDHLKRTVYLKISNNPVTDIVSVETKDYCKVDLKLSYRVTFGGTDSAKWFSIENYVKFLCDNMRSVLRHSIKKLSIQEFYENTAGILRDIILGPKGEDGIRPGRTYQENMMEVADVEVLGIALDKEIEGLFVGAQRAVVKQQLDLESSMRDLVFISEREGLKRKLIKEQEVTQEAEQEIKRRSIVSIAETGALKLSKDKEEAEAKEKIVLDVEKIKDEVEGLRRSRQEADIALKISAEKKLAEIQEQRIRVDAEALKAKAEAITPALVGALSSFGAAELVSRFAEALGPTQILKVMGGSDVTSVIHGLLEGTPFAARLKELSERK